MNDVRLYAYQTPYFDAGEFAFYRQHDRAESTLGHGTSIIISLPR